MRRAGALSHLPQPPCALDTDSGWLFDDHWHPRLQDPNRYRLGRLYRSDRNQAVETLCEQLLQIRMYTGKTESVRIGLAPVGIEIADRHQVDSTGMPLRVVSPRRPVVSCRVLTGTGVIGWAHACGCEEKGQCSEDGVHVGDSTARI